MTVLIMLDLSTACHVIYYPISLKRLKVAFGIKENDLTWVKSHFTDKTQFASVTNKTSTGVGPQLDVSQGSFLERKNYSTQKKVFGDINRRPNIKYHGNNDDT